MPPTDPPSSAYVYEALGKGDIRIATLFPGRGLEPICISLDVVQLCENDYEALSYSWGASTNPEDIFIMGHESYLSRLGSIISSSSRQRKARNLSMSRLAIGRNLFNALCHLRGKMAPRKLWIDAICINQEDMAERSEQVKRMAEVYAKTKRVVVWLGEEDEMSTKALASLKVLSKKILVDWEMLEMRPISNSTKEAHWAGRGGVLPWDFSTCSSILKLLNRSWFERLWIWQEIGLAPEMSILVCGDASIKWDHFRTAVFWLSNKTIPEEWSESDEFLDRRDHVFKLCARPAEKFDFSQLAEETRGTKCTDPRDRVFALMSLLHTSARLDIQADYTSSLMAVYRDLFLCEVKRAKNLDILRSCELHDDKQSMPTWIPDWSYPRQAIGLEICRAASTSNGDFRSNSRFFSTMGVSIAEVRHVYAISLKISDRYSDAKEEIFKIYSFLISNSTNSTNSQNLGSLDAFCRTMVGNKLRDRSVPPREDIPSFATGLEAISALIKAASSSGFVGPIEHRYYMTTAQYCLAGRSFYITDQGGIGLGPHGTQPGDTIAVFLDCDAPMMLRRDAAEEDCFKVVGETYCHGYMYGESLVGPLPPHYQYISYRDDEGDMLEGYQNSKTGEVEEEDPRVASVELPAGWKKEYEKEPGISRIRFVDSTAEEGSDGTWRDPRLTADALRSRGVQLESFTLV